MLNRKDKAFYRNEDHSHQASVDGKVMQFVGVIFHDDRKPLARWFSAQHRYDREEAEHLLVSDRKAIGRTDRNQLAAWLARRSYFSCIRSSFNGFLLDSWPGWCYALQRLLFETVLALDLIDRRLRRAVERNCL